jgi:hypothetical protein
VPNPLIIGDLNAYTEEDPIHTLEAAGYTGLSERFVPEASRYSFVFDGFSGELDHGLAGADLVDNVTGATIWHINADEPLILDYNTEFNPPGLYEPNAYRSSDHDPLIIGLSLGPPPPPPPAPGTVVVWKFGIGRARAVGVTFTLYADAAPVGGSRGPEDATAVATCTTVRFLFVTGLCSMTSVPVGRYWLVETVPPTNRPVAPIPVSVDDHGPTRGDVDTIPVLNLPR